MLTGDGYGATIDTYYATTEYDWQLYCHNIGKCWDNCPVCNDDVEQYEETE